MARTLILSNSTTHVMCQVFPPKGKPRVHSTLEKIQEVHSDTQSTATLNLLYLDAAWYNRWQTERRLLTNCLVEPKGLVIGLMKFLANRARPPLPHEPESSMSTTLTHSIRTHSFQHIVTCIWRLHVCRLLASGVKGVDKPDKSTGVRAEAEGDPASLIQLWCLHEKYKYLPIGAKLGADATGVCYGVNKTTGKLDCYLVRNTFLR